MNDPNLQNLESAVSQLGELADEFVFVGGSVVGLLITDEASSRPRPTEDVDVIVEVASQREYHQVGSLLRKKGFSENPEHDVICRWTAELGLKLDVMPTTPVLGFHNRWYPAAMRNAEMIQLPSGREIRVTNATYFIATKIEAFNSRGGNDFLASHDLEDLLSIVEGRPGIVSEIREADEDVQRFIQSSFSEFLLERSFLEALPGHILDSAESPELIKIVTDRIQTIAQTESLQ